MGLEYASDLYAFPLSFLLVTRTGFFIWAIDAVESHKSEFKGYVLKSAPIAIAVAFFTGLAVADPVPAAKQHESTVALPDSFARQQFKLLSREALNELAREAKKEGRTGAIKAPLTQNARKDPTAANVQQLEAITVYVDSEDYVTPKLPPMLVFRATLDKQRPRTPQEITQGLLCAIGLCTIDTSKEPNVADRNEARAKAAPNFAKYR